MPGNPKSPIAKDRLVFTPEAIITNDQEMTGFTYPLGCSKESLLILFSNHNTTDTRELQWTYRTAAILVQYFGISRMFLPSTYIFSSVDDNKKAKTRAMAVREYDIVRVCAKLLEAILRLHLNGDLAKCLAIERSGYLDVMSRYCPTLSDMFLEILVELVGDFCGNKTGTTLAEIGSAAYVSEVLKRSNMTPWYRYKGGGRNTNPKDQLVRVSQAKLDKSVAKMGERERRRCTCQGAPLDRDLCARWLSRIKVHIDEMNLFHDLLEESERVMGLKLGYELLREKVKVKKLTAAEIKKNPALVQYTQQDAYQLGLLDAPCEAHDETAQQVFDRVSKWSVRRKTLCSEGATGYLSDEDYEVRSSTPMAPARPPLRSGFDRRSYQPARTLYSPRDSTESNGPPRQLGSRSRSAMSRSYAGHAPFNWSSSSATPSPQSRSDTVSQRFTSSNDRILLVDQWTAAQRNASQLNHSGAMTAREVEEYLQSPVTVHQN